MVSIKIVFKKFLFFPPIYLYQFFPLQDNIDIPLLVKLLNFIENPGGTMYAEAVSVDLMTLILAYNLHHRNNVQNNVLMQALTHEDIKYPEVLLEKVLLFFNRGGKQFLLQLQFKNINSKM